MSEMKLIMESWGAFLEEEQQSALDQIKQKPQQISRLVKKVASSDPVQQKKAAQALVSDPEVRAATKILKQMAAQQNVSEGAIADKMLSTYIKGSNRLADFFETPQGQQLKKFGGPVLALALIALKVPEIDGSDVGIIGKLAMAANINSEEAASSIVDVMTEDTEEQENQWSL